MTEQEAKTLAEPIVKAIVDCIAEATYELIPDYAEFKDGWTIELLKEVTEAFLEDNELSHYDKYGVPCNFQPKYDKSLYDQFSIYIFNNANGNGFAVEYDLTTNGELNDLTLKMEFLFEDNNEIKAYIEGVHVL